MFFSVKKRNILNDGKIAKEDWEKIAKKLQCTHHNVYDHWRKVLEPILQRHHSGSHHLDIKEMLIEHLSEMKVKFRQDVD